MQRLPVTRPVAVVLLVAAITATVAVGAVLATPVSATEPTSASASATESTGANASVTDPSSPQTMDATITRLDNFTVTVETPSTIVANASQSYAVNVVGADGNVTATWTFENETKDGTRVTHAFAEDGNASIEVTVTDESGATVTKTLQVEVVEFGDDDDDPSTVDNFATFGLWIGMFFVLTFGFILVLLPKGMQVITDAL